MRYATYTIRALAIATFLALMVFNVDVVGSQGPELAVSSTEVRCEWCDENSVLCARYVFPDGHTILEYDETGVVVTPDDDVGLNPVEDY
jgi:hypothetical protein